MSYNQLAKKDGVLEIPVTGFYKDEIITFGPLKYKRVKDRFCKTDIDFCGFDDLTWFLNEAVENNLSVINFFMHSYSLLKFHKKI